MWHSINPGIYLALALLALAILLYTIYNKHQIQTKLSQHYAMVSLQLSNLPKTSPTRQRLEAARKCFDDGWQVNSSNADTNCLELVCPPAFASVSVWRL